MARKEVVGMVDSGRDVDIVVPKTVFAGRRNIVKSGSRYAVYLPATFEPLWRKLHEAGVKVDVYLEVVEKGGEDGEG